MSSDQIREHKDQHLPTSADVGARTDNGNRPRGNLWRGLKPLLLRIHFYAGLFVAPFIFVAAATGILFAAAPPLEQVIYRDQLRVPQGATPISLSDQIRAAQVAVPGGELSRVRPAPDPGATTRVEFRTAESGDDYRTAFVDPYTGEIRGLQTTASKWMELRTNLESFHSELGLGDIGSLYSELAASWVWVIAITGFVLWVFRSGRHGRLRAIALPTRRGSPRQRRLSWHAGLGVWVFIGILGVAATGLTWSQFAGDNVDTVRSSLNWKTPTVDRTLPTAPELGPDQLGAFEVSLHAARSAGLDGPVEISPGKAGQAWRVGQIKTDWPMKQDVVAVDPVSGVIVDRVNAADWPIAAKLANWGIYLHMGVLFGAVNTILLILLGVSMMAMIVLGYRMWWQRRPRAGVAGPPTRAQPSTGAYLLVGALAVVLGIAIPVLGASLLVFLVADIVRSIFVSRRASRAQ